MEYKLKELGIFETGSTLIKKIGNFPAFGGNGIITYVNKWNVDEDAIIIGRVGANCGCVNITNKKSFVTDNALIFKPKEKNMARFYFYFLLHLNLNKFHIGSSQPLLTQGILGNIKINIPSLNKCQKISKILDNIDNQIERNNSMVQKLQVMGQAIFNRWFLQFEHFKKDNKFKYNEDLNLKIPENWEVKKIAEICKIFLGGTPSTKNREYWNGEINWLNSGEVANFPIIDSEKTINEKGLKNSNTKLLKKGTVVISITGNIRVSYLAIDSCINQSIVGIEENELLKIGYLYPFLKNKIEFLIRSSTGNCQKHINKNFIENLKIVLPPKNVLDIFNNLTQNIYAKISQISLMTKKLIKFKNKLLPLLINQQII
ncbi:restriction endonuclease subunit S [Mycoplasmopsis fermentans]|uniref:Restriction modification system DNA specificity domain n=2 Tax=Mycoplasmopsis fermentans TaxID=2115 RepID=A0AB32XD47_MYCFM|nr:restriction endonuclease subunit S [Mycoplasmopsis fermentans]ADV35020.1 Restriction modification system DNA specificity domain [Mycoplasmopsis fermentans M64]